MDKKTVKSRPHWSQVLVDKSACKEAITFAKTQPSFFKAWRTCGRADWMLWWLQRSVPDTQASRERLTCMVITITLAIPNRIVIPEWDTWAQDFLKGKNRKDQLARSAAWSAARSAARSAESAAESAARSAAWSAVWSAARSAVWSAARSAAYQRNADIVRSYYPRPIVATQRRRRAA